MPEAMERALQHEADKKHLSGDRRDAFVYGTMRKTGWKPAREMHVPGGSMHEVLYTNGDNGPVPDHTVIPGNAREFSGAVTTEHTRVDNYGNRWLDPEFEYPEYEGLPAGCAQETANHDPAVMGQDRSAPGADVPGDYPVGGGPTTSPIRKANELAAGSGDSQGHAGQRSDKWPAIGMLGFKPGDHEKGSQ